LRSCDHQRLERDASVDARLLPSVGGLKRLRSHDCDLLLVCTQSRILKVFEITGLTKVFSIHDSVDAAVGGGSDGGSAT